MYLGPNSTLTSSSSSEKCSKSHKKTTIIHWTSVKLFLNFFSVISYFQLWNSVDNMSLYQAVHQPHSRNHTWTLTQTYKRDMAYKSWLTPNRWYVPVLASLESPLWHDNRKRGHLGWLSSRITHLLRTLS